MVKSTRNRRPFTLVYFEKFDNKKLAFKREWHLKHPKGYLDKLNILKSMGTENTIMGR
jgi:predicted GIY-YIG superfamily endonuclease